MNGIRILLVEDNFLGRNRRTSGQGYAAQVVEDRGESNGDSSSLVTWEMSDRSFVEIGSGVDIHRGFGTVARRTRSMTFRTGDAVRRGRALVLRDGGSGVEGLFHLSRRGEEKSSIGRKRQPPKEVCSQLVTV